MQVPSIDPVPAPTETGGSVGGSESGRIAAIGSQPNDPNQTNLPVSEQFKLLRDPVIFTETYCRDEADSPSAQWQLDFRRSYRVVDDHGRIDLTRFPIQLACAWVNESGKTKEMSKCIRYLLSTVPGCGIGVISHVYRQLEMLQRYLQRQVPKFPGWKLIEGELIAPNGNWCRWFATETAAAVESLHAPFMVAIIDEEKEMEDDIVDAVGRWRPKLRIEMSSKGLARGRFYERFTKDNDFWKTFEVSADMCPWIDAKQSQQQTIELGREHPLIKSMIFNEWNDWGIRGVLSLQEMNHCFDKRKLIEWRHDGIRVGGLDVSAAAQDGDECVGFHRCGNKMFPPHKFVGYANYMDLCQAIIKWALDLQLDYLYVDNGGAGAVVVDILSSVLIRLNGSLKLVRVDFGGNANNPEKYGNKATEMYFSAAQKFRELYWIIPEGETITKLRAQFCTRPVETMDDNTPKLVSKKRIKTKPWFLKSPDYADAFVMCALKPPREVEASKTHGIDYHLRQMENEGEEFNRSKYNASPSGHIYGGV